MQLDEVAKWHNDRRYVGPLPKRIHSHPASKDTTNQSKGNDMPNSRRIPFTNIQHLWARNHEPSPPMRKIPSLELQWNAT